MDASPNIAEQKHGSHVMLYMGLGANVLYKQQHQKSSKRLFCNILDAKQQQHGVTETIEIWECCSSHASPWNAKAHHAKNRQVGKNKMPHITHRLCCVWVNKRGKGFILKRSHSSCRFQSCCSWSLHLPWKCWLKIIISGVELYYLPVCHLYFVAAINVGIGFCLKEKMSIVL